VPAPPPPAAGKPLAGNVAPACDKPIPPTPAEQELLRFPPAEAVDAAVAWSWKHEKWLQTYANQGEWQRRRAALALADLRERRLAWSALSSARWCRWGHNPGAAWEGTLEAERREHLARLRKLIGDADYATGRLPAAVPLERLEWR
jgi:hypothetical protein